MLRKLLMAAALAAAVFGVCGTATAQDYPTRTITLVVPYPPGGGVDAWRASSPTSFRRRSASRSWSTIAPAAPGWSAPAPSIKSAPDGYTLFLGHTGSISINPSLYANAGFDPRKDSRRSA